MGYTTSSRAQVNALLDRLERAWPGEDYDLFQRNCCTFCTAFCEQLGVGPIPARLHRLADTGGAFAAPTSLPRARTPQPQPP
jgi:hypothetical protein